MLWLLTRVIWHTFLTILYKKFKTVQQQYIYFKCKFNNLNYYSVCSQYINIYTCIYIFIFIIKVSTFI